MAKEGSEYSKACEVMRLHVKQFLQLEVARFQQTSGGLKPSYRAMTDILLGPAIELGLLKDKPR